MKRKKSVGYNIGLMHKVYGQLERSFNIGMQLLEAPAPLNRCVRFTERYTQARLECVLESVIWAQLISRERTATID